MTSNRFPSIRQLLCLAVVGFMMLVSAAPSAAAEELIPIPETGEPGLLSLSSSVYPLKFPALEPADTFSWQIGVSLSGHASATTTLQLTAAGLLASGHRISVEECGSPWQGTSGRNQVLECDGGALPRVPATTLTELNRDVRIQLRDLHAGTPHYLMFRLERPAGTALPADGTLLLGIGVTAAGDEEEVVPPSRLKDEGGIRDPGVQLGNTGAQVASALLAGTGLLLLGGAIVIALRGNSAVRRKRDSHELH